MDFLVLVGCLLLVILLPLPFIVISDFKRNRAFRRLARIYHLSVGIKYYPLTKFLDRDDKLILRQLEGSFNGHTIIVADEYSNRYSDPNVSSEGKHKLRYVIPWWGRYLFMTPNNADQYTRIKIDDQEIIVLGQENTIWSGFARPSVLKSLIEGK